MPGKGRGGPRRGYSWPPAIAGNDLALKHGAGSPRHVLPKAAEIEAALLADAEIPAWLRTAQFAAARKAWAEAEAIADLMLTWLATLDMTALTTPRKAATKSPVDLWRSAHSHAANLRSKLGLDPVSYARIAKDLGIAQAASEDALSRLAETGKTIRERRERELQVVADDSA